MVCGAPPLQDRKTETRTSPLPTCVGGRVEEAAEKVADKGKEMKKDANT